MPALLHHILREGDQRLVTPGKCMEHTRQNVLSLLKGWADEQEKTGVVPVDWEPRTLDESPFYPGWEAVWRTAQGFLIFSLFFPLSLSIFSKNVKDGEVCFKGVLWI